MTKAPTLKALRAACARQGHTLIEDRASMRQFTIYVHEGDSVNGVTEHKHFASATDPSLADVAAWADRLHREAEDARTVLVDAEPTAYATPSMTSSVVEDVPTDECTVICEAHGELAAAHYGPDDDHEAAGLCAAVRDAHLAASPGCAVSIVRESLSSADALRALADHREREGVEAGRALSEDIRQRRDARYRREQAARRASTPAAGRHAPRRDHFII